MLCSSPICHRIFLFLLSGVCRFAMFGVLQDVWVGIVPVSDGLGDEK